MKHWKTILAMTIILVVFVIVAVLLVYFKNDYIEKWDVSLESDNSVYACLTYAEGSSKKDKRPYYNLSIKGNGSMREFTEQNTDDGYENAPWYEKYNNYIKKVTIEESVTFIQENSFINMVSLESVSIESYVSNISAGAFANCTKLSNLHIGANVINIGQQSFSNCPNLTTITIVEKNENLAVVDNVLYNKNITSLLLYPSNKAGESYIMPNSVTEVYSGAFYESKNLKQITLSTNLTTIPQDAFYSSSITSITIPSKVTTIQDNAFGNCQSLESVVFNENLTYIGCRAFQNCTSLKEIKLSEKLEQIGEYAFYNCNSVTTIYVNEKLGEVGNYAFSKCEGMTDLYIKNAMVLSECVEKTESCGKMFANAKKLYIAQSLLGGTSGDYFTQVSNDITPTLEKIDGVDYNLYLVS